MDAQTFILLSLALLAIGFVIVVEVLSFLNGLRTLYLIFDPRPTPYVHPNNMKVVPKDQ